MRSFPLLLVDFKNGRKVLRTKWNFRTMAKNRRTRQNKPMNNFKTFKPETSKRYTIALKYPTGKQVPGFAGPELRWILMTGEAFYTPLDFAAKLEDLNIRPGQRFQVEKRANGRKAEWIVSHLPALQSKPPQKAIEITSAAGSLDAPFGLDQANVDPMPESRPTALETALKTAVSAAAEAEKHGAAIGYSVRFASADIKSMAISVLIGMEQRDRAA
jgi:hypothetical protein